MLLFNLHSSVCEQTVNNDVLYDISLVFLCSGNSKWDWLVEYKGAAWAFLLHTWLANKKVPTLVVQYEILIEHTERELIKILEFLNLSNTNNSVKCAVENGSGMFRRTKHLDFNPYSIENCKAMNRYISQAAPILAQYGIKYDHRPSS